MPSSRNAGRFTLVIGAGQGFGHASGRLGDGVHRIDGATFVDGDAAIGRPVRPSVDAGAAVGDIGSERLR